MSFEIEGHPKYKFLWKMTAIACFLPIPFSAGLDAQRPEDFDTTGDFKINGQYVITPEKGLFDEYVEEASIEYLDKAGKSAQPFFMGSDAFPKGRLPVRNLTGNLARREVKKNTPKLRAPYLKAILPEFGRQGPDRRS